ncbi:agenet domain-containing protein [Tanacetum coccineum]
MYKAYICQFQKEIQWTPRLFWAAASCTIEQQFMQIMDQIKQLDEGAYDYLIQRNPNSWSRAFFEMDKRCAAFENGISESFNRAILEPRHKPIITMLEEIRLYIMQRLVAMNKIATNLEDTITPSIRKRLELLKEKQREWLVIPSGFQELEVRKDDQSYGVNLQHKVCQCRMWELSGVPCVHAVAAYLHCGIEIDLGVSHWGRGRGGSENEASGSGMGGIDEASGGGRGGTGGRGRRGRGMKSSVGGEEVVVEEHQLSDMKMEGEEREWEEKNDYFNPANFREDSLEEAPFNHTYAEKNVDEFPGMVTQCEYKLMWLEGFDLQGKKSCHCTAVDKGQRRVESVAEQAIANTKEKKAFEFDKHGTGSTPDKAFDVSD